MFNVWYLVFAFIPILILGIILSVRSKRYGWFDDKGSAMGTSGMILTTFAVAVLITLLIIAIFLPITAKREYREFINTKEMVEEIYNEDSTFENAGLANTIIDLNKWLAEAKASKEMYGNWSMYYALDLDNLEYIQLNVAP